MSTKRNKRGSSGIQWEIVEEEDVDFEKNFHLGNRKLVKSPGFDDGIFLNTVIGDEGYDGFNDIDPISDCLPIDVEEEEDDGKSYVSGYWEGYEVNCVNCDEEVELCDDLMGTGTGNAVTGRVGKEEVREGGKRHVLKGDGDWSLEVECGSIGVSGFGGGGGGGRGKKGKRVVDDEDKIDSQYKIFLENMRVEDHYVLEVDGDDEVVDEDDKVNCAMRDELGNEIPLGMGERLKSYYEGENKKEDFMKCGSRGEKNKSSKTLTRGKTKILGNMRNDLGKERCSSSLRALINSSGRKRKNDDDDEDRYKTCPKNWRDGKSVVFEVSDTDEVDAANVDVEKINCRYKMILKNRRHGKSSVVGVLATDEVEYVNYGKEEESCDEIKLGTGKRLKSSSKGDNTEKGTIQGLPGGEKNRSPRNLSKVLEDLNTMGPGNMKDDLRKECCRTEGVSAKAAGRVSAKAAGRKGKSVELEVGVAKRYYLDHVHLSESTYNLEGPHVKVDEANKSVGCLKNSDSETPGSQRGIEQAQYVKDKERAEQVKYGAKKNDGHTMILCKERCEKMYSTNEERDKQAKYDANEEHIGYMEYKNVSVDKKGSRFRERLMDILKKPYNQEEYDDLMREVSRRKLEGRGRKYGSKSLLDQHMDLVRKIDLVHSDNHQVLNLLRGFAYWLQHLVDKSSFPPWKDPECLKVLPES